MPSLGKLTVEIGAETSKLDRGADASERKLTRLSNAMRGVIGQATKLGIAAGIAGAAIAGAFVKAGLEAIDTQTKLARTLGATNDGLRAVQIAGADAGADMEIMNSALERMQSRIGEALRDPISRSAEALRNLNINIEDFSRMDVDQRMATLADQVQKFGLNAAQTGDVLRQLGIRNGELINLLRDGGDAFRAARQEVDDFGLSISEVDAAKVELANDAMSRIRRHLEGIRNQVTVQVAPILLEVANRINDVAKANGGWAQVTRDSSQKVVNALGRVLDVLHGIKVAFEGLKLIGYGFGAAMVSIAEIVVKALAKVADAAINMTNTVIEGVNKLPKVDIATIDPFSDSAFVRGFESMAGSMRDNVVEMREHLHELAMEPMPSSSIRQFFEEVTEAADKAAAEAVATRAQMGGLAEGFGVEDPEADAQRAEEERLRDALQKRVDAIRESQMTEMELATMHHEEKLAALQEALEQELVLETEYNELKAGLEEDHQKNMREIREAAYTDMQRFQAMSFKNQTKTVLGELTTLTSGVASENKRMFELNKAAGISQAIINVYEGVSKTLKSYPYPVNIGMAAAHAAAAFAQVQAIKSQTFGGGGGAAPSLAGSTAAPPVSDVGGGGQKQSIFIEGLDPGSLFSGKAVRGLIEQINDAAADGAKVVIA